MVHLWSVHQMYSSWVHSLLLLCPMITCIYVEQLRWYKKKKFGPLGCTILIDHSLSKPLGTMHSQLKWLKWPQSITKPSWLMCQDNFKILKGCDDWLSIEQLEVNDLVVLLRDGIYVTWKLTSLTRTTPPTSYINKVSCIRMHIHIKVLPLKLYVCWLSNWRNDYDKTMELVDINFPWKVDVHQSFANYWL